MQWRRHFGAVGIMARISWVSASCVDSRFRATGKTQVKPQQQFRGRSEMIPKSSIMFRFLLFQAQSACTTKTLTLPEESAVLVSARRGSRFTTRPDFGRGVARAVYLLVNPSFCPELTLPPTHYPQPESRPHGEATG